MDRIGEIISEIFGKLRDAFSELGFDSVDGAGTLYTAIARWVFILLALFIVCKSIASLLRGRSAPEVFAYFNVGGEKTYPVTHWENAIGRSKSCDLRVNDAAVSRTQGTLTRDDKGRWKFLDLGSSNGTVVNGKVLKKNDSAYLDHGDEIIMGDTACSLMPVSLEEQKNNKALRKRETFLLSPWTSIIALTVFQFMTIFQLKLSMGEEYNDQIFIGILALTITMWIYVIGLRSFHQRAFEAEIIAFFISTISLAVTASKYPEGVIKQYAAILIGLVLFIAMCWFMRNLERTKFVRKYLIGISVFALAFTLIFAETIQGADNWIKIGGLSIQPSEMVKLAFIWCGAASLDELLERRNTLIFMGFAAYCFGCLALMNDFGTALIFFVSFVVISFLRNGDVTKLILVVGVAAVGGMLVLRFKSYVATRFAAWGHVWEYADSMGYQQTRTMSAAASGGLIGVGAGNGWLKYIAASETDLVFGFVAEEWGLIIAVLTVISIITLSVFAVRSIINGRSAYYTIAACSAMSLFLFQTILNVFGSVDLFPLTGVTFPFLSTGGTSMVASWGMLAFVKAADNRQGASMAVKDTKLEEVNPYA